MSKKEIDLILARLSNNILTLLIVCFIALMIWIIGDRQAKIHEDKFK